MGAVASFALVICLAAATPLRDGFTLIDGRAVHYVIANLNRVHVEAALGGAWVGETGWLADIARRSHAIAAINGGYFEAYRPGVRKNLDETLVVDGTLIFKGDVGSVLFFDHKNHAWIERIPMRIDGSLDGSDRYPNNWYAYWLNRLPGRHEQTITIFTPAWGKTTELFGGPQIQVSGGVVTDISYGPAPIPRNGYVIFFRGEERVASHFWIGRRASYTVTTAEGLPLGDFADAWQAVGGGPQFLVQGIFFADPRDEGFRDPKVFGSGVRSMVGVNRDRSELILAVTDGTLDECARIMRHLGAYDAMGLDGGASSGLWADGHYLVSPGREVNNALLVKE